MNAITKIANKYWVYVFIPVAYSVGTAIDQGETRRMCEFRDKSMLFGQNRKEGDYSPWEYYFPNEIRKPASEFDES